MAFYVLICR